MKYKKYNHNNISKIYEFECYNLIDIENDFGKRKWRIGKFLDLLYRKRIRVRGNEDGDFLSVKGYVYVSNKDIEGILGVYYYKDSIKILIDKGLIFKDDSGNKRNRFDYNKKLSFFKLNDEFFNCNKKKIEIESGVLNRYLDKRNERITEEFITKSDDLLLWEKYCCVNSDLNIQNLDEVIDLRVENKLNEMSEKLSWDFVGIKMKDRINKNLNDIESWKNKYRIDKKNEYDIIVDDLNYLKSNKFSDLDNVFKRDGYGKRLYNCYSRVIREYRKYIKIDNEEVVELDIKSCFLSLLYVFIKRLNSDIDDDLIIDVKKKLTELDGSFESRNGIEFVNKFKSIFENDGIYSNEDNSIEFRDYYDLIRLSYGEKKYNELSRNSFKELVFKVLFSDSNIKKTIKMGDENIDEVENRLFGVEGKKLMNDLRKIDLNNWIENKGGRIKKYNRGNNISLILMNYENRVMDILRLILMKKRIKFISVFDSLMVKKSDYKEIFKLGNSVLSDIDKSLKFSVKTDLSWEEIKTI